MKTILHYALEEKLGEGGMGEVFRARDTRMNRIVALKLLPADVAGDRERIARFEREARAASALNHPHIVSIYDTGQADGVPFLAMELIDGHALNAWVQREKPELRKILEVITQVADALTAAHDAGIVHRDIKPANLLVTSQSYAKVLDFGLAKLTESRLPTEETQSVEKPISKTGSVMGTVAYMSPEQALGRPVDARADIFALGAVLYEAVTGRRAFPGATDIDILHAIVHATPSAVHKGNKLAPAELQWIIDKALAKDTSERYQTMREFAADLRRLRRRMESGSTSDLEAQVAPPARRAPPWMWAAGGVLLTLVVVAALWPLLMKRASVSQTAAPQAAATLANISLTPLTNDPGYEGEPTFSPDGETIAYTSDRTGNFEIFLKQVSGGPDINLTNNPADDVQPAFSPDGAQIAFVSTRSSTSHLHYGSTDLPLLGGDIWVMPALGGTPRRIATEGNFPSWTPDGASVVYSAGPWFNQKILKVTASGGEPREIPVRFAADVAAPSHLLYPRYSPDGHWIVFEAVPSIYVMPGDGGQAVDIGTGSSPAWSADSRAIIYSTGEAGKNRALWRVPFDPDKGAKAGRAEPLTAGHGWDMHAAVSRDGKRIAFTALDVSFNIEALPFDADKGRANGAPRAMTSGRDIIYFFSASPDGASVAYISRRGSAPHILRSDRGSPSIPLTSGAKFADDAPRWSPDGRSIAFGRRSLEPGGVSGIWLMGADGTDPRLVIEKADGEAWMPDSNGLVYYSDADRQLHVRDLKSGNDRRVTNEPKVMPIFSVSPDGQWVVFQSTQAGLVDLRAVPLAGGPTLIVVPGPRQFNHPSFSPSGKWLYCQPDHKNLYRVPGPAQGWRKAEPQKATDFPESGLFLDDPQIGRSGREAFFSHGHVTGDIWLLTLGK